MATAQIIYSPGPGIQVVSTITVNESYPDAVDQARTEAIKLFREAFAEARVDWATPEGEADVPDA